MKFKALYISKSIYTFILHEYLIYIQDTSISVLYSAILHTKEGIESHFIFKDIINLVSGGKCGK